MKIKDLLFEIKKCKKKYGKNFLNWDIYTEQLDNEDKRFKIKENWETIKDSEGWIHFKCFGFWTKFVKKKIFTINVNY